MKQPILLALATLFSLNTSASDNEPNIIHDIPSPVDLVLDIAYDGEHLWVAGWKSAFIYCISPVDGSIITTIPSITETPRGLTHDGDYLWVVDSDGHTVYKLNDRNGSVITSFEIASEHADFAAGFAFDGKFTWSLDTEDLIHPIDENLVFVQRDLHGDVIKEFTIQKGNGGGLTWVDNSLWYSDNYYDMIYQVDPNRGIIVDSLDAPGGNYPNGMAYDGKYLWLANGDSDRLYQIAIESESDPIQSDISLQMNLYPNPSADAMTLEFEISEAEFVSLQLVNNLGQQMKVIVSSELQPGTHSYTWLGEDETGVRVEPGIYYAILTVGNRTLTKQAIRGR